MYDNNYKKYEPREVDATTKAIYIIKKITYSRVCHNLTALSPAQQKHFAFDKDFIDGYESGMIRSWKDHYETPEACVKRWSGYTPEQNKKKLEKMELSFKK